MLFHAISRITYPLRQNRGDATLRPSRIRFLSLTLRQDHHFAMLRRTQSKRQTRDTRSNHQEIRCHVAGIMTG
jgi:hypothetical protein